jgi:hypothetical protein
MNKSSERRDRSCFRHKERECGLSFSKILVRIRLK